mmetsp:Transcript_9667/g.25724  ORF Transcript_9667/g.25724 Transcript_9667/m.25724 type:complete len:264 (-) Transcript_9667:58-849(-)
MRSRYFLQIAMFSSNGSSERSSMCEENNGSPFFSKYSSDALIMPSNQGNQAFWQWSECKITGTPYNFATARTCKAPATDPAMQAASSVLSAALPAMNCPPPREKVTMMGPPAFLAASMHALMEPVPTILTPGIANSFSLAWFRRSTNACPVTTPGFTVGGIFVNSLTAARTTLARAARLPAFAAQAATPTAPMAKAPTWAGEGPAAACPCCWLCTLWLVTCARCEACGATKALSAEDAQYVAAPAKAAVLSFDGMARTQGSKK